MRRFASALAGIAFRRGGRSLPCSTRPLRGPNFPAAAALTGGVGAALAYAAACVDSEAPSTPVSHAVPETSTKSEKVEDAKGADRSGAAMRCACGRFSRLSVLTTTGMFAPCVRHAVGDIDVMSIGCAPEGDDDLAPEGSGFPSFCLEDTMTWEEGAVRTRVCVGTRICHAPLERGTEVYT